MTTWWGWAVRRARASAGLLLTLLALVATTTGILAGAVGYSQAAATSAARSSLADTAPSNAAIRVQTRLADEDSRQQQDEAARRRIAEAFRPAAVEIDRSLASEPRPVRQGEKLLDGGLIVLSADSLRAEPPGVDNRVALVDGAWPAADGEEADADPSTPVPGVLHASAAAEWGMKAGDTIEVGETPVLITGTWRPADPDDPYWFGDPLTLTGRLDATRGPLLVDGDTAGAARLLGEPFVRWVVRPDHDRIGPDDLDGLAAAAGSLRWLLKDPSIDVRGVTVTGDLAPTAAEAHRNLATAQALGLIPLSVLVIVTLLAGVQLARLLAATREQQIGLLIARGASRRQVVLSTLAESLVVTILGTAIGAGLAWAVLGAVGAGHAPSGTVIQVAALTGALVWVVLAAVTIVQVRQLARAGAAPDVSGRVKAATAASAVVLVVGAAGVAWWQLRRTGSPLVVREDGSLRTDLVAGAAPALLLAAAAIIAMALLGPASRVIARATHPSRAVGGHLAAAQVSRRLAVYAAPVVLTVLAVGSATMAGLYSQTAANVRGDLAAITRGAPIRAELLDTPIPQGTGEVPASVTSLGQAEGVTSLTPVWLDPNARLGDVTVPSTVASAVDLREVILRPRGMSADTLVPVSELGAAPSLGGLVLLAGTREVVVSVEATLGIPKSTLISVQASYENLIPQFMVDGGNGEDAKRAAQEAIEASFAELEDSKDWSVTLVLLEEESGRVHEVAAKPFAIDLPRITASGPPYDEAKTTPGGGSGRAVFTLPPGSSHRLLDVRFSFDAVPERALELLPLTVDVAVSATADGKPLFGEQTRGWGSEELATRRLADHLREEKKNNPTPSVITHTDPGSGDIWWTNEEVHIPGDLDTEGSRWLMRGDTGGNWPADITVGPGRTYQEGESLSLEGAPLPGSPDDNRVRTTVPVVLTGQAADAANLALGDEAQMVVLNTVVPVKISAIVPALPGSTEPLGALFDREVLSVALVKAGKGLPAPTELWIAADQPDRPRIVSELSGRPGIAAVSAAQGTAVTDATRAAGLVFWVASAGAMVLALTGVAAVAATLLSARRSEVAVLRALGMPPGAQGRSRTAELGGVLGAAMLLGLLAGWLVSAAVVPALVATITSRTGIALPTALSLDPLPWGIVLGAGLLTAAVVLAVQSIRVRRQALDNDYREEIR